MFNLKVDVTMITVPEKFLTEQITHTDSNAPQSH